MGDLKQVGWMKQNHHIYFGKSWRHYVALGLLMGNFRHQSVYIDIHQPMRRIVGKCASLLRFDLTQCYLIVDHGRLSPLTSLIIVSYYVRYLLPFSWFKETAAMWASKLVQVFTCCQSPMFSDRHTLRLFVCALIEDAVAWSWHTAGKLFHYSITMAMLLVVMGIVVSYSV